MVRAVLTPGEAGRRAYEQWRRGVDVQRLDPSSTTLLVPLSHRWGGEADDEVAAQVVKVSRMTWLRGQLLTTWTAPALVDLAEHGVPFVLSKGAAVLHHAGLDHRARPMDDVDVLVPFERLAVAARRLVALGFDNELAQLIAHRPQAVQRSLHGVVFRDARGARVDLHWHLLANRLHPRADDAAWVAAVPATWGGVPVRVTSREDTLVHVVVHGAGFMSNPALRWATDAAALIRTGPVDWDVVAARAARLRLGPVVADSLDYLASVAPDLAIPSSVVATLAREPRSATERLLSRVESLGTATAPAFGWRRSAALAAADWRRDLDQSVAPGARPSLRDLARVVAFERRELRAAYTPPRVAVGDQISGRLRPAGRSNPQLVAGWHYPEPHGTWTSRRRARIVIALAQPEDCPLDLVATLVPFVSPQQPRMEVRVRIDGRVAGTWVFQGTELALRRRKVHIPARVGRDRVDVVLEIRAPLTGYDNGHYGDERALGVTWRRGFLRRAGA